MRKKWRDISPVEVTFTWLEIEYNSWCGEVSAKAQSRKQTSCREASKLKQPCRAEGTTFHIDAETVGIEMQAWRSMGERIGLQDGFILLSPAYSWKEFWKILFVKDLHLVSILGCLAEDGWEDNKDTFRETLRGINNLGERWEKSGVGRQQEGWKEVWTYEMWI